MTGRTGGPDPRPGPGASVDRVVRVGRRAHAHTRAAARTAARTALTRWDRGLAWLDRLGLDENAILLTFAVAVGLATAAGVVLFYRAIDAQLRPVLPLAGGRAAATAVPRSTARC